jgi:hypothetical protein
MGRFRTKDKSGSGIQPAKSNSGKKGDTGAQTLDKPNYEQFTGAVADAPCLKVLLKTQKPTEKDLYDFFGEGMVRSVASRFPAEYKLLVDRNTPPFTEWPLPEMSDPLPSLGPPPAQVDPDAPTAEEVEQTRLHRQAKAERTLRLRKRIEGEELSIANSKKRQVELWAFLYGQLSPRVIAMLMESIEGQAALAPATCCALKLIHVLRSCINGGLATQNRRRDFYTADRQLIEYQQGASSLFEYHGLSLHLAKVREVARLRCLEAGIVDVGHSITEDQRVRMFVEGLDPDCTRHSKARHAERAAVAEFRAAYNGTDTTQAQVDWRQLHCATVTKVYARLLEQTAEITYNPQPSHQLELRVEKLLQQNNAFRGVFATLAGRGGRGGGNGGRGGGGRGRGGDGSRDTRKCFNCGQPGHLKANCKQGGGAAGADPGAAAAAGAGAPAAPTPAPAAAAPAKKQSGKGGGVKKSNY